MRPTMFMLIFLLTPIAAYLKYDTKFFEKLPLSSKCNQQFELFATNFSTDQDSWAFQMASATSQVPFGLLYLNFGNTGNFDQCINIQTEEISGKYCLGLISPNNETTLQESKRRIPGFKEWRSIPTIRTVIRQTATWSLCVPHYCTAADADMIGNEFLRTFFEKQKIKINFYENFCQTVADVKPQMTIAAKAMVSVLTFLLILVLLCTLYDIHCLIYKKTTSSSIIIQGFSIYTNAKRIVQRTTDHHLSCLDALKLICTLWIMLFHQYSTAASVSISNIDHFIKWTYSSHSMLIIGSTFAVETFLTISGTLMTYSFLKTRYKNKDLSLFNFIFHRYIRLTVPLVVMVLIKATLLVHLGSGPKWPIIKSNYQEKCMKHLWSQLFYLQNYIQGNSNLCIGQTWYLIVDTQLYVIVSSGLYILYKKPKILLTFLAAGILFSISFSFYVAWKYKLCALKTNLYCNYDDYYSKYFIFTHTRATPFFIGTALGYYLFQNERKHRTPKLSKRFVSFMWVLCSLIFFTSVFGWYHDLHDEEYHPWLNANHIALVRPIWSLATSWIILACTYNYGGFLQTIFLHRIYQIIAKFMYSLYLTHGTVLNIIHYNKKLPNYFTDSRMIYEFFGLVGYSIGVSVLMVFIIECPVIAIVKILLEKRRKKCE